MEEQTFDELMQLALNPDKAPEALLKIKERVHNLETLNATLTNDNTQKSERISSLQDSNLYLYRLVGGTPGKEDKIEDKTEIDPREELKQLFEIKREE